MSTADDVLVPFQNVSIIRSSAIAVLCRVAGKAVWLPRQHVRGRLSKIRQRGDLSIRYWVARDLGLIDLHGNPRAAVAVIADLHPHPGRLRLVHAHPGAGSIG